MALTAAIAFLPISRNWSSCLVLSGTLVARLLSWQERLTGLQELAQWEVALLVGLDILQAARDPTSVAGASKGLLRGEGQGANVGEV